MTRPTGLDVLNVHIEAPPSYDLATLAPASAGAGLRARLFPADEAVRVSSLTVTSQSRIWHPGRLEIRLAETVHRSTLVLLHQGGLLRWLGPWSTERGTGTHILPLGGAMVHTGAHRPVLEPASIYLTEPLDIHIFQWATGDAPAAAARLTRIEQPGVTHVPSRTLLVLPDLWGSSASLLRRVSQECNRAGATVSFGAYSEILGFDQMDGHADPVEQAARLSAQLAEMRAAPHLPLDILAERRGTLIARALVDTAALPTPGQLIAIGGARSGAMALRDMIDLRTTELVAQNMEALAPLGAQLRTWLQGDPEGPWHPPQSLPKEFGARSPGATPSSQLRLLARWLDVALPCARPDTISAIADAVAPLFGDGDHELIAPRAEGRDLGPEGAGLADVMRTPWSPFASDFPILGSQAAARQLATWLDPSAAPPTRRPQRDAVVPPAPDRPRTAPYAPPPPPFMPSGPSRAHPVAARTTRSPEAPERSKSTKTDKVELSARATMPSSPPARQPVSIAVTLAGAEVVLASDGLPPQTIRADAVGRLTVMVTALANGRVLTPQTGVEADIPRPNECSTWLFPVICEAPGPASFAAEVWDGPARLFLGRLDVEADGNSADPTVVVDSVRAIDEPMTGLVTLRVVDTQTAEGRTALHFTLTGLNLNIEGTQYLDAGRYERFITQTLEQLDETFAKVPSSAIIDDRLVALGVRMADSLLPPVVRDALWTRREEIAAIQLVSEEQRLPWEVLHVDDPRSDARGFFLAEKGLTRWFRNRDFPKQVGPRPLNPAAAVRPFYGRGALPAAVKETERLRTLITEMAYWPARTHLLLRHLKQPRPLGLLHFAGHGIATIASDEASQILGDVDDRGNADVPESHVIAAHLRLRPEDAPLVFLNACFGGLSGRGFAQAEGYARAFIAPRRGGGASAFIGPSWRVGDEAAQHFAGTLYDSLADGAPLHAAVTQARQATAQFLGNLTWLAYAVYGDPMARYDSNACAPMG